MPFTQKDCDTGSEDQVWVRILAFLYTFVLFCALCYFVLCAISPTEYFTSQPPTNNYVKPNSPDPPPPPTRIRDNGLVIISCIYLELDN